MRIAAIQMRSGPEPEENLTALRPMVADAAAAGARYVLTPEVTMAFAENREGLARVAGPFENNPWLAKLSALAREQRIYLHIGSMAVALPDGRFANRSVLFAPDGTVATIYDKIHLFDATIAGLNAYRESATYRGGETAVTAKIDTVTLGLAICYDMRFPALFTLLANQGAELISVPAAFTVPTGQAHWHVLLRARAIETGSYVVAAAQGGNHANGRATYGHSLVIDPWGKIIAELDHDAPGVLLAEIDPAAVREARERIPALANARPFAAGALAMEPIGS